MIAAPEALTFEVSGLKLAARAWGPRDGRPALALHGWLDNAATFDRLVPLLSPGLRIIALDLPGHGLSQHRSADATYSIPDAVTDVAMLLHSMGNAKTTLIGHSMGAAISAILAGTIPERVEKLVLLEGLGPLTEEAPAAPARLEQAIGDQIRRGVSKTRVFPDLDDAAARVVEAAPMELGSAKILLARGLQSVGSGFTWRTDPRLRLATRLRLTEAHVAAFMQRITAETLLVLATNGWPAPAEVIERRKGYVRKLTAVTVEGRHHVHLDAPEIVAPHINRFLGP